MEAALSTTAPSGASETALNYIDDQWPKLTRYVENGRWPIDNNPREKFLRRGAVDNCVSVSFGFSQIRIKYYAWFRQFVQTGAIIYVVSARPGTVGENEVF